MIFKDCDFIGQLLRWAYASYSTLIVKIPSYLSFGLQILESCILLFKDCV